MENKTNNDKSTWPIFLLKGIILSQPIENKSFLPMKSAQEQKMSVPRQLDAKWNYNYNCNDLPLTFRTALLFCTLFANPLLFRVLSCYTFLLPFWRISKKARKSCDCPSQVLFLFFYRLGSCVIPIQILFCWIHQIHRGV